MPKKTKRLPNKFKPGYVEEAMRLITIGLPQKEMAWFWGISEDSVSRWKKTIPEFADAIKKGEANRKISLLKAMYDNAIHSRNPALQIFLAKNWLGMRDVHDQNISSDQPIRISVIPADGKGNGKGDGGNGQPAPRDEG